MHKGEWLKFIVSASMMSLILFVYSIQRGCKDAIIISSLGAELISTIKLFGVLPFAIFAMLAYARLIHSFNTTKVFHIINAFFISFFLIFTFILYPNTGFLNFDLSFIYQEFPRSKYLLTMIENWSIALYYISAELWGSVMLSLLFWKTANKLFKTSQAQRLYPLFGFFAQIGLIAAGSYIQFVTGVGSTWQMSLTCINLAVAVAGILLSCGYWYLTNVVIDNDKFNGTSEKKKKSKPSFKDSLKYVFTSKYILLITTLIVCYGISINLVEGVWKKQVELLFPNVSDFAAFTGVLQKYTGMTTMVTMIIGSYCLKLISWRMAAIFTPIMILLTGGAFFVFVNFGGSFDLSVLMYTPLVMAVYAGLIQNILSKATKYTFFDSTKEMAYIPLNSELKSKGKAAADVIGGRLGKSGGAIIQNALLVILPGSTLISLAPTLFAVFSVVMVVWIIAVNILSKEYIDITAEGGH